MEDTYNLFRIMWKQHGRTYADCILGKAFLECEPSLCFGVSLQYSYVVLSHLFSLTWLYAGTGVYFRPFYGENWYNCKALFLPDFFFFFSCQKNKQECRGRREKNVYLHYYFYNGLRREKRLRKITPFLLS